MMTLRNMREHGVHSLAIRCGALWCNHEAIFDVSTYADGLTVPALPLPLRQINAASWATRKMHCCGEGRL